MNDDLNRFLNIWLPATQHGTYRAFAWWEGGFGVRNKISFYPVGDRETDRAVIASLAEQHPELFFYASTFKQKSTKTEYAEPSNCLWLDFDHADPRGVTLQVDPPTLLWETSETNYQGLWLLDQQLPQSQRVEMNRAIYEQYREYGADASYDASRRLRLPGTVNLKPGRGEWWGRIVSTGGIYSPSEITPFRPSGDTGTVFDPGSVQVGQADALGVFERYGVPELVRRMWKSPAKGDRSSHMAGILIRLARLGVPPDAMFIVGHTATDNKFKDRPEVLWKEIEKAIAKFPPKEQKSDTPSRGWTLHTWAELMAIDPNIEWLVPGYWPQGACGVVYGLPGSRKSWIVTHFMMSVLSGNDFLGQPVNLPGPVIYHGLDDPMKQVSVRCRNVADAMGIDLRDDVRFHWSDAGFSFTSADWVEKMKADIDQVQPVLVVVDGLYLAGYSSLDHGASLPSLMAPLKELRKHPPYPAFLIIHHAAKAGASDLDVRIGGAGSVFLSAWSEVAWKMDGQGIDERGMQVVHLDAASKFGPPPTPIKLAFGGDVDVYEVEYEGRELSEENVIRALDVGSMEGITTSDLAALMGRAPKVVEVLLLKMEAQGMIAVSGKGQNRKWQRATGIV